MNYEIIFNIIDIDTNDVLIETNCVSDIIVPNKNDKIMINLLYYEVISVNRIYQNILSNKIKILVNVKKD